MSEGNVVDQIYGERRGIERDLGQTESMTENTRTQEKISFDECLYCSWNIT